MSGSTVKIEVCDCGRPRQVGAACRSCGRSEPPGSAVLTGSLGAAGSADGLAHATARQGIWLSRGRLLRAVIIAPVLASLLIWSTLTPAVLVRVASLTICVALLILIVWPSNDPGDG